MKKKLSSDLTLIYKNSWLGFVIGMCLILFFTDMPSSGKVLYFICFTLGAFFFWAQYQGLKTVELDENFLYVSDGKSKAAIPLSTIKSVYQEWLMTRYIVIIVKLKIETKFGLEIQFMPYYAFGTLFRQHPVVNEIKQLASLPVR